MDSIIIQPRDQEELNFFLELAKRLGLQVKSYDDLKDEQLLAHMEKNKKSSLIEKKRFWILLKIFLMIIPKKYKK